MQGGQLENIGSVYRDKGEYDNAIEPYIKALKIFETLDDKYQLANQYTNLGYIHVMKNDIHSAMTWYHSAQEVYKALKEDKLAEYTQQNIDHLSHQLNRPH